MDEEKGSKRATQAERQKRISNVLTMRGRGISETHIVQSLMQSENLSQRQAERYVAEVRQIIAGLGNMPTDEQIGLLNKRLEVIYSETLLSENKDIPTANAILANGIKLLSLQTKQINPKGGLSGDRATSVTDEFLTPELEELLQAFDEDEEIE